MPVDLDKLIAKHKLVVAYNPAVDLNRLIAKHSGRSGGMVSQHRVAPASVAKTLNLTWSPQGHGPVINPALIRSREIWSPSGPVTIYIAFGADFTEQERIELAVWSRTHNFTNAEERWEQDRRSGRPLSDADLTDRLVFEMGTGGSSHVYATEPQGKRVMIEGINPWSTSSRVTLDGHKGKITGKQLLLVARKVLALPAPE